MCRSVVVGARILSRTVAFPLVSAGPTCPEGPDPVPAPAGRWAGACRVAWLHVGACRSGLWRAAGCPLARPLDAVPVARGKCRSRTDVGTRSQHRGPGGYEVVWRRQGLVGMPSGGSPAYALRQLGRGRPDVYRTYWSLQQLGGSVPGSKRPLKDQASLVMPTVLMCFPETQARAMHTPPRRSRLQVGLV
jgi:hypothetical protein